MIISLITHLCKILNNGATFVKVNGKSGMSITGWECK